MTQASNAFSSLLREASIFAYPEKYQLIKDQCSLISVKVEHAEPHHKEIVIMLEFHHDKSEKIDISFFGQRWSSYTQENMIPPWVQRIDEFCVDQVESEQELIQSRPKSSINAKKLDTINIKKARFQLGKINIIECELSAQKICTAGIFIPVIYEKESKKPVFKTCLDAIIAIQNAQNLASTSDTNQVVKMFKFIESAFGIPILIGIMTGRQDRFKLIFRNIPDSAKLKNILQSKFCPEKSSVFIDTVISVANEVMRIQDIGIARMCLDLNPQAGTIDNRLCIEIMPSHPNTETKTWGILTQIEKICHLDSKEVQHVRQTHRHLPIGFKPDPILSMLSKAFGVTKQNSSSKCATSKSVKLSHYKICIEPRKAITIKSYSYLKDTPLD